MHIQELLSVITAAAPPECAASWDQSGVQVAAKREHVHKLAVGLDATADWVDQAVQWGADFLLVHHPLAIKPQLPSRLGTYHHVVKTLMTSDVWLYAAHTSLDTQPHGPVQWLARELALENVRVLEQTGRRAARWRRVLGSPEAIALTLRELSDMPGLRIFNQTRDGFEVVSGPEHDQHCKTVLASHGSGEIFIFSQELDQPSETLGFGFVGNLPQPQPWDDFALSMQNILRQPLRRLAGEIPDTVRRIACCPGSGASFVQRAAQAQAQVFLTGDLKYHDAQAVQDHGLLVADVGHFILEERMMRILATQLQAQLRDFSVEVAFFQGSDAFTHAA